MEGGKWNEAVVAVVLMPLLLPLLLHPGLLVGALHPVHDASGFRPSIAGTHSSGRPWPYFSSDDHPKDHPHPSEQPTSPPTPTRDPMMMIRQTYHPLADESASPSEASVQEEAGKEENGEEEGEESKKEVEAKKPEFDPTLPSNVTAQHGSHAFLPCRVLHRGDKSVSWVRKGDSHILSVNQYIFITDDRFVSLHQEASDTWSLQIKYVQARDSGMYECQVSTEPKISKAVYLKVISPKVSIAGQGDVYVKAGSTVSLKCVITNTLTPPDFIFWYQDKTRILADYPHVRLLVTRMSKQTTIASLLIMRVSRHSSGRYTCAPANLPSAAVKLHVLNDEYPAAMQHGTSVATQANALYVICAVAIVLLSSIVLPQNVEAICSATNLAASRMKAKGRDAAFIIFHKFVSSANSERRVRCPSKYVPRETWEIVDSPKTSRSISQQR